MRHKFSTPMSHFAPRTMFLSSSKQRKDFNYENSSMALSSRLVISIVIFFALLFITFFSGTEDFIVPTVAPPATGVAPPAALDDESASLKLQKVNHNVWNTKPPARAPQSSVEQSDATSGPYNDQLQQQQQHSQQEKAASGAAPLHENVLAVEPEVDVAHHDEEFIFSIPRYLRHPNVVMRRCSTLHIDIAQLVSFNRSNSSARNVSRNSTSDGAKNATTTVVQRETLVPVEVDCNFTVSADALYEVKSNLHSFFHLYDSQPEWIASRSVPTLIVICGDSKQIPPDSRSRWNSIHKLELDARASALDTPFDCLQVLPQLNDLKAPVGHVLLFVVSSNSSSPSSPSADADARWVGTFMELERAFPARVSVFTRSRAENNATCSSALALASRLAFKWVKPRIPRLFWLFPSFRVGDARPNSRSLDASLAHFARFVGEGGAGGTFSRFFDMAQLQEQFFVPRHGADGATVPTKKRRRAPAFNSVRGEVVESDDGHEDDGRWCVCQGVMIDSVFQSTLDAVEESEKLSLMSSDLMKKKKEQKEAVKHHSNQQLMTECRSLEATLFARAQRDQSVGDSYMKQFGTPAPPPAILYPRRDYSGGRGRIRSSHHMGPTQSDDEIRRDVFGGRSKNARDFCSC